MAENDDSPIIRSGEFFNDLYHRYYIYSPQQARTFLKVQAKKTREIKLINFTKNIFFFTKPIFCYFKNG